MDCKKIFFKLCFISHIKICSIADKIIVLRKGIAIEENSSDEIFNNPIEEYTKNLIRSVL